MEKITIGKLADLAGVNVETVRFYQREGLIKEPPKKNSGFRYYDQNTISRIIFIKKVQELGFSLKEIKEFLEINTRPRDTCDLVKVKLSQKVSEIDQKIADLKKIKRSLLKINCACEEGPVEMKKIKVMDCFESNCC